MKTRKRYLILSVITLSILVVGSVGSGQNQKSDREDSLKNDKYGNKIELENSRYQSEKSGDGEYFNNPTLPDSNESMIIMTPNDKTEIVRVLPLT